MAVGLWLNPVRHYRDLRVWQEAHQFTLNLYRLTQRFPREELYGLTSQIRRASSSIAANLAKGCGRRSEREMLRFVQIAIGSASELDYHLLLARDIGFLNSDQYHALHSALDRVRKRLNALAHRDCAAAIARGETGLAKGQKPKSQKRSLGSNLGLAHISC